MTVNVRKKRRYRLRRVACEIPRGLVTDGDMPSGGRLYILLTLIAAAGVLAGACAYDGREIIAGGEPMNVFLKSLCSVTIYTVVFFLGGLSVAGQPAGYALCAFKGLGAGYLAAYGIASGSVGTALNVLPFEAVSMVTVILGARENIRMSALVSRRTFGAASEAPRTEDLRLYFEKFALIMLSGIFAAATDGLMAAIF